MSEPTIDEMLEWVDEAWIHGEVTGKIRVMVGAIRAILEQHRDGGDIDVHSLNRIPPKRTYAVVPRGELEAVRAFVERVDKRVHSSSCINDWMAMQGELAAMEKEAE
jgi:hypothetical protein